MTRTERLASVAAGLVLAVALTWPLASDMVRLGRADSGDGRYSLWNVAWVAHALLTRPTRVFDANIFDPARGTLAYSEANLVAGVLAVPAWAASHNPYLAMNVLILLTFTLGFAAAWALARHVGAGRAGAALAGISYAFCPFLYSHLPHIQLLMAFVLPVALIAMHRFVDAPSARRAVSLGLALALAGLACGYYGVFGGLAAGLGVLWFGLTSPRRRPFRYWVLALAAAAVAGLLVAPFFQPYLAVQAEGFGRTLADAEVNSADWRAYLASPMRLHVWMLPWLGSWKEVLFPGFLPLAFAAVAVSGLRRRGPGAAAHHGAPPVAVAREGVRPGVLGFYLLLAVLALWASFGPDAGLYAWLHQTLPVFGLLRAPSRLGLLVTLAVSVLAAAGLSSVLGRLPVRVGRPLSVVVLALAIAGAVTPSFNLVRAPEVPSVYRILAGLPRAPVVEFPFFADTFDRQRHTEYMLMSIVHWQPLVNGYSDHFPPAAVDDLRRLSTFPSADAWRALADHGARYVVMHWDLYPLDDARSIRAAWDDARGVLRPIAQSGAVELYEVDVARLRQRYGGR